MGKNEMERLEKNNLKRIDSLDLLRGIAALAVAWFHFTGPHLESESVYNLSQYGYLGVTVFFVISGFIIPYSLHQARYTVRHFNVFILKRVLRLDPPYLMTIFIIIFLGYLSTRSSAFHGQPFHVSWSQLLLHFGYLNAFVNPDSWLNIVFWSLAIEFQFYLLIGLIYPLLSSSAAVYRIIPLILLCPLCIWLNTDSYVFHYIFIFFMGISTYQYKVGIISRSSYSTILVVLAIGAVLSLGPLKALSGIITVAAINFINFRASIFILLGNISYSIYLLHIPIGIKVIHLGNRLLGNTTLGILTVNLIALSVTIFVAFIFYKLVEKPSQKLSSKIRYEVASSQSFFVKSTPEASA
jgi:peptidoglycan/LPS O-acetylase OafA/YrhL